MTAPLKVSAKKAKPFDRPWSQRKRELQGFVRDSLIEMAKFYVDKFLMDHFKRDAFSKYGYKPRSARYNQRKLDLVRRGLVPQRIGRSDRYHFIPGTFTNRDLIWTDEWRDHLRKTSPEAHRYRASVNSKPQKVVARIRLPHEIHPSYKGELGFKTNEEIKVIAKFFRERMVSRLLTHFQGG